MDGARAAAPYSGADGRRARPIHPPDTILQTLIELTTTKQQTWRDRAACRGIDPEIFYPVSDEEVDAARAICAVCPVREACLEHALSSREKEGIWGGCTERERRRIIRQRRRSA